MSNTWVNIFSLVYPVGAIYETADNAISPDILFGLTWELIDTRTVGEDTIYTYKRTA